MVVSEEVELEGGGRAGVLRMIGGIISVLCKRITDIKSLQSNLWNT